MKTNNGPLGLSMNSNRVNGRRIGELKRESLKRAIDSLAKGGYAMFGLFATQWTTLNQIDARKEPNPFKGIVAEARKLHGREVDGNR